MELRYDGGEITKIKVIGIGGGGNNTIDRMVEANLQGAEFIAMNTDLQQLNRSKAPVKLQLGAKATLGRGCGAKPERGRKSAEENKAEITELLKGTDMVFITAGMGGGTGTGGAPVVAEIARSMGILTVGVVTRPFKFEGAQRAKQAEAGLAEFHPYVDSLVVIPNERLKYVTDQKITFLNAFAYADDVLKQAISSIYELITMQGLISLDFADVQTVMQNSGYAHMGVGRAAGRDKANEAAKMAIQSPLLETSIRGAKGVLINIIGSPDLELDEVDDAASIVRENADPDATIIFGAAIDESLNDEMRITIIATGFEDDHPTMIEGGTPKEQPRAARPQGIDAELPFNRTASQKAKTEQTAPETQGFSEEYERILAMLRGS